MKKLTVIVLLILSTLSIVVASDIKNTSKKKFAYLVNDIKIPFWEIMSRGIQSKAKSLGYEVTIYSANNLRKKELQNTIAVIKSKVDGMIISPISSSTAVTILDFATKSNIPVVISDIGSDGGDYVSYISSDNEQGAYEIAEVLVQKMKELDWHDGSVGIIAIPQKRANGKARTKGFMKALNKAGIKSSGLLQQVDFSYEETYRHSVNLIKKDPKIRALWLQGSDKYQGALDAIADMGKSGEILLICFDAEPEFLDLIPQGKLVGAAMQQPFLMGEIAVETLYNHINGKQQKKEIQLPILAVSTENIDENLPIIKRNVLGIQSP